jgi:hypothetical protein
MASGKLMARHKGMEVKTTDGKSLGKIAHVWFGDDPGSSQRCDEEVCSRLEVHLPRRGGTRYIPYNAIAGVSGQTVSLNITEAVVHNKLWQQRPSWLPADAFDAGFDHLVRPHPEQDNG